MFGSEIGGETQGVGTHEGTHTRYVSNYLQTNKRGTIRQKTVRISRSRPLGFFPSLVSKKRQRTSSIGRNEFHRLNFNQCRLFYRSVVVDLFTNGLLIRGIGSVLLCILIGDREYLRSKSQNGLPPPSIVKCNFNSFCLFRFVKTIPKLIKVS